MSMPITQRPRRGPRTRAATLPRLMSVALATAHRGYSVFPVWPRTKIPALHGEDDCPGTGACADGHQGWEQRATRDPELIRSWWRARSFNVGIATGPSKLVVLDLDTAHGHPAPPEWPGALHGRDVLARLAERADQPVPWDTYTVRTPTGGMHLYFQAPAEPQLRSTVARAGWRIDSRAAGGAVLAPGSVRAEGMYRVVRRHPVAPLPTWLVPLLLPPPVPELAGPSPRPVQPASEARKTAYMQAVAWNAARAEEGSRHDTLLRAACTLGRLVAGGDLDDGEARAALYTAAAELERRGFPAREAERVIHDGLRWGKGYRRRLAG